MVHLSDPVSPRDRVLVLVSCVLSVVGLLICEQYVGGDIPLGGLFLLPLFVAAAIVSRWSIFLFSNVMAGMRE
jgi:hypothetical protein